MTFSLFAKMADLEERLYLVEDLVSCDPSSLHKKEKKKSFVLFQITLKNIS